MSREDEYIEMFRAEALESFEALNNALIELEKEPSNSTHIDTIFRVTHTLKGNAMGLGLTGIAELSHIMEDVFGSIKQNSLNLDKPLFEILFKATDKLGALIDSLETKKRVSYKGIRTKLSVHLKKYSGEENFTSENDGISEPENDAKIVESEIENLNVEETQSSISFSDYVNVPVKKLDSLLNLVGELLIEKDSLITNNEVKNGTSLDFTRLHRITSDLQYGVMGVRLVQVGFMFNKFQRIVRDVAKTENKEVELIFEGTEIEIDRNILKILSDSMIHLVRNAISHGIETPEVRKEKGKNSKGKLLLRATNEKDTVFISIMDDGNGMDPNKIINKAISKGLVDSNTAQKLSEEEKLNYIFAPGFSNAETITEISGRGVGMDVVKRATESIGGRVELSTELGKGSTIRLALPSSMALKGALLFKLKEQEYAIPLAYTEAVISLKKKDIHKITNGLMSKYLDQSMFVLYLNNLFENNEFNTIDTDYHKSFDEHLDNELLDIVVISYEKTYVGFIVDKLLQQKEIVEKTLRKPLDQIPFFSGATILGNGQVCLVLDIPNIFKNVLRKNKNH